MSRESGRCRTTLRAVLGGIAGAALLLCGSPVPVGAQAAPPTTAPAPQDLAKTRPVAIEGIDPVLDAVEVDPTPAIRRADDALGAATASQNEAALRWLDAERTRAELADKAGRAGQIAAEAKATAEAAMVDQAAKEQKLAEREQVEARHLATLTDRQAELRGMVAKLYATAPEDRYAVLGSLADLTEADRRAALRERGSALQVGRVRDARRPWSKAHEARIAAERQVATARFVTATTGAEATKTADERDRYDQLVRASEDAVRTAITGFEDAQARSREVLVDRRTARLESTVADLDLPLVALDAYWRASAMAPCRVPWWVIAGIGKVESGHGSAHRSSLTAEGDTTVHIIGIPLNGAGATAAISDTDGGRLDDDPVWDRAVGPMQFIPGTWGRWAADGNADEKADPHNIYDAAGAAARYLCFTRGDLVTEAKIRTALLAYNRSVPYGTKVLAEGGRYRDALDLPEVPADAEEPDAAGAGD